MLSFLIFFLLSMMAGVTPEVGIGGRHIADALVVAVVVVIFDEFVDLVFKITR